MVFDKWYNGVPVAFILTSCSDQDDLILWMRALDSSMKRENPNWRPNAFIVDCAQGEINNLRWVCNHSISLLLSVHAVFHTIYDWNTSCRQFVVLGQALGSYPSALTVGVDVGFTIVSKLWVIVDFSDVGWCGCKSPYSYACGMFIGPSKSIHA